MKQSPTVKRIGVLLHGFGKTNLSAFRFLMLKMNSIQHVFDFEFLPFDTTDPFIESLSVKAKLDRDSVEKEIPSFLERYKKLLVFSTLSFDLQEVPPDHFVLVTMARFSDNYYATHKGKLSILALGNWKRFMAPPSLLEFILILTLKEAFSALSPSIHDLYHFGTKGCLFDFTPTIDHARYKVLNANICKNCQMALEKHIPTEFMDEILFVLSKEWFGQPSNPMSPASITSKLEYNLFTTKGLDSTAWEKFINIIQQESAKQIVWILSSIILACLILWLGLK